MEGGRGIQLHHVVLHGVTWLILTRDIKVGLLSLGVSLAPYAAVDGQFAIITRGPNIADVCLKPHLNDPAGMQDQIRLSSHVDGH